jgi:hypothetical protein
MSSALPGNNVILKKTPKGKPLKNLSDPSVASLRCLPQDDKFETLEKLKNSVILKEASDGKPMKNPQDLSSAFIGSAFQDDKFSVFQGSLFSALQNSQYNNIFRKFQIYLTPRLDNDGV